MADKFIPGRLSDLKVVLKNADGSRSATITSMIRQISITEDIFKNTLYGSVAIRDATELLGGLPDNFPIIGEEFLEIDYEVDWLPSAVRSPGLRFAVYKISNIQYANNNTKKEYILHFCSEEHIIDATYVVMKAYSGQHSDNIKNLLQDYLQIDKKDTPFKGKRIKPLDKLEPTRGLQNICIPRLPPLQAAQLIARRSISDTTEFNSGTYLFFENFKGFNFCCIEYLIKQGIQKAKAGGALNPESDFRYVFENPTVDKDKAQPREKQTILRMTHKSFFDTIEKLKNGMFESDVLVYDYVDHKTIPTRYRFLDNDDKTNSKSLVLGGQDGTSYPENSITFMKSVTSTDDKDIKYSRFFFIPKDTSATNQDTFLDIIYPSRASYFTRLAQNMMTLDVYGNPNINAGDVIFIQVPEGNPNDPSMLNRFTSGFYLICTINHILTQTTYQCKWDVYKNAFSAKVESTDEAKQTKVTGTDNNKTIADSNQDPMQNLFPNVPEDAKTVLPFIGSLLF